MLRSAQPGTWFHVFNRGVARCDIFRSDADRVEFGRLLGVANERYGIIVHAYCLMANHYHLVVECPQGQLSEAMHDVGSVFVRHANERTGRDGPLFRARFSSKPISDHDYLRRLVRYVHHNPLAFLPPDDLVRYRWSSLRTYLGLRRRPNWLHTDEVLAVFGGPEAFRSEMSIAGAAVVNPSPASVSVCLAAIDLMLEVHLEDAVRQGVDRTVAALLSEQLDLQTAQRLRKELAYASPAAEAKAIQRARRRAREDPQLNEIVAAVQHFLTGGHVVPGTTCP